MFDNYKFDNLKEENIFLKIGKKLFYFLLFGIIFYLLFIGIGAKDINAASLFDKNVKLLKNSSDGRIYAVIGNKKHIIKTPKIFNSYNYNFNKVKTVSCEKIAFYPDVYLAKLTNNPAVYYINNKLNIKKAHLNKKVFLSYGNKWKDIFIFSKQDLDSYKNAQLIKLANSPIVYEIHNNLKRPIKNESEFINLGYHWKDIIIVNKIDLESYQDIANNQKFASQPIIQNELVAQIDPSSPKTSYLLTGSKHNLIAKIKFISNSSKPIEIKKIIFQKLGVSNNKIYSKFYLQDDYGKYTQTSIDGGKIKFYFNQNPILLQPGSSRIFEIRIDLNQIDNVLNQTIGIGIKNAKDIEANANVVGNFPLLSSIHKIISGKDFIGELSVDSLPINNNAPIFAEIGSTDVLLSKIKLTELTHKEDVVVRRIIFTNIGSIDDNDIINFDLVNDDNKRIIKTVKSMQNHQVIFDLENSPLIVKQGDNLNLILRGDIEGKQGLTAKFVIYDNNDIRATSSTYGCDITVKPGIIDNSFPVGNLNQELIIKQGRLVAYLSEKFPQSKIIAGEKNANLASFTIQLSGMNIFLNKIELEIEKTNGALDLYGNIKIEQERGNKILTKVLAKNYCGKSNLIDLPQIKLNSGTKYTFNILANIDKNDPQGSAYIVKLNKIYYQVGNFDKVISPNIMGHKKIVNRSQLTVYLNPKFHNCLQVAGAEKVKIASFLLQSNSSEDQIIKSIQLSLIGKTNSMSFSKGYSNLSIYQNNDKKALIKWLTNPSYVLMTKIYAQANKTIKLDIYVDTTPANNGDNIQLRIDNIIAKGLSSHNNTFVKYNTHNGQSINLLSSSLSVELNNELSNGQILAEKNNQIISSIKITNNSAEDIYLKNITVANADGSDSISYLNGYNNFHFSGIWDRIRYPVDNSNKLDLKNKKIKSGKTLVLNLEVNTNDETAGDKLQMIFYGLEAKGSLSKKPIKIIGLPITGQKMDVVAEN